jgi:DNA-binding transcriptional MerR regulator
MCDSNDRDGCIVEPRYGACVEEAWRFRLDSATLHWQDTGVPEDERHTLTELADLAGVTPRTVRFYLAQGLLPSTRLAGSSSRYDAGHLARLRLIRRLQGEHLPLAEIRRRLDELGDDEIRDLGAGDAPTPPADSALDYLRTVLAGPQSPRARPGLARATLLRSRPPTRPPGPDPASRSIERSQWERIVLAPDVELHIRRPLPRAQNKQVDRLVTIARELLEEDRP